MNAIATWFSKFTTGTHITVASVVALFGTVFTLYQSVPAFQTLCNHIYAGIPVWAQGVIMAAIGIFLFYYRPTATPLSLEKSQSEVKADIAAKIGMILLVAFLLIPMAGCKPAPLPQGAYTAPDAQINEDLQAAHAALVQYAADVKSGAHVPTAQEKVVVNKLIDAVNIADPAYQSYHAALAANPTAPEPAALIAALANVASNLSALEALIK